MNDAIETVRAIYRAFGAGDIPALLGHLDPDIEWEHDAADHGVPWLAPGRGHEHVARFFERLQALELRHFEPLAFLAGENQVAVTVRLKAVVKATGCSIEDVEVHLWTVGREGRMVRFRHVLDTHQHFAAWRG